MALPLLLKLAAPRFRVPLAWMIPVAELAREAPPVLSVTPLPILILPSLVGKLVSARELKGWIVPSPARFVSGTPMVLEVLAAVVMIPEFAIEPVPLTVAPESVSVPSFWNGKLSASELLNAPLRPTSRNSVPPVPPIEPPLQLSVPALAIVMKLDPVRLPPERIKLLLNCEALVTARESEDGIWTGLSALTLFAVAAPLI